MFDGIKILCTGVSAKEWKQNKLLKFFSYVDIETGEIFTNRQRAFYKGLYFYLIPSTVNKNIHCVIKGSLATYHNNAKGNNYDYTHEQLLTTLADLENKFSIDPKTAIIQNLEIGVNLHTAISVDEVLKALKCYGKDIFVKEGTDREFNGKRVMKQEYQYKVYDKESQTKNKKQAKQSPKNTIRIELAIKSQKQLRAKNISTLEDLKAPQNVLKLSDKLVSIWQNITYIDKGVQWRKMTDKERIKWLYYSNADNWGGLCKMQRLRAKKLINSLKAKYSKTDQQTIIYKLMKDKINQLLNYQTGEAVAPPPEAVAPPPSARHCIKCNADITNKKKGTLYCSKKCNNSTHAHKRKLKRRINAIQETKKLKQIQSHINKGKYNDCAITIHYKLQGNNYADTLTCLDIEQPPEWWIRKVYKIILYAPNRSPIELTSIRAKELLRTLKIFHNTKNQNNESTKVL